MNNAKIMVISRSGLETISVGFKVLSMTHYRYSPKEFQGPSLSTREYNLMKSVDTHVSSTLCHDLIKMYGRSLDK
jgi:hypothetical protein